MNDRIKNHRRRQREKNTSPKIINGLENDETRPDHFFPSPTPKYTHQSFDRLKGHSANESQ